MHRQDLDDGALEARASVTTSRPSPPSCLGEKQLHASRPGTAPRTGPAWPAPSAGGARPRPRTSGSNSAARRDRSSHGSARRRCWLVMKAYRFGRRSGDFLLRDRRRLRSRDSLLSCPRKGAAGPGAAQGAKSNKTIPCALISHRRIADAGVGDGDSLLFAPAPHPPKPSPSWAKSKLSPGASPGALPANRPAGSANAASPVRLFCRRHLRRIAGRGGVDLDAVAAVLLGDIEPLVGEAEQFAEGGAAARRSRRRGWPTAHAGARAAKTRPCGSPA